MHRRNVTPAMSQGHTTQRGSPAPIIAIQALKPNPAVHRATGFFMLQNQTTKPSILRKSPSSSGGISPATIAFQSPRNALAIRQTRSRGDFFTQPGMQSGCLRTAKRLAGFHRNIGPSDVSLPAYHLVITDIRPSAAGRLCAYCLENLI